MTWNQLKEQNRRWGFCLTIAGLKYRYYDVVAPPSTVMNGSSISYEDSPSLIDIGSISDRLSPKGGIAEHAAHNISLSSNSVNATSDSDPAIVFGRVTSKSAFWSANLAASYSRDSTGSIEIDASPSSLTFPRLFHIDGETVYATGFSASPLSLTGISRAVGRSPRQDHSFSDPESDLGATQSEITTEVCHWRTRWATIHVVPVYDDGTSGEWVELIHGFIDTTPQLSEDGTTVEFSLAPLTALLDTSLVSQFDFTRKTSLVHGYHHFSWPECCTMQHAQYLPGAKNYFSVDSYDSASSPKRLYVQNATINHWNYAWDTSLPSGVNHPRRGYFDPAFPGYGEVTGTGNDAILGDYYEVDFGWPGTNVSTVMPAASLELHNCQVDSSLVTFGDNKTMKWPFDVATSVRSGVNGWTTGTTVATDDGSWLNVDMTGRSFSFFSNVSYNEYMFFLWKTGKGDSYVLDDNVSGFEWSTGEGIEPPRTKDRLYYPIVPIDRVGDYRLERNFDILAEDVVGRTTRTDTEKTFEFEPALGFYQTGERYILLKDQIPAPCTLAITIPENNRDPDSVGTYYVRIVSVASDATSSGYIAKINSNDFFECPSFGDWGTGIQENRVTIKVISFLKDKTSAELMLELLSSGGGNNINGNYDELIYGLNIPSTSSPASGSGVWGPLKILDEDTFYISGDEVVESWTIRIDEETTVRDLIESACIATSTSIAMQRRDDGLCMLRRIDVGPGMSRQSIGEILDGDWLTSVTPRTIIDDEVVTRQSYKTDFEHPWGPITTNINDSRALRTHGESETLELELRGMDLNPTGGPPSVDDGMRLQGLFLHISSILSDERVVWRGSIPTSLAMGMHIGSVYEISSRFLKGYNPSFGVTSEIARLISLDVNLTTEGATVEFVFYDRNGTGWNACMEVSSYINPTTLKVASNQFTALRNVYSRNVQTDIDYFSVGDSVYVYVKGDRDGGSTLVIAGISGTLIQFTAAHPFSPGDKGYIETPTFTTATPAQQQLAHLADSNGELGVGIAGYELL